VEEYRSECKDMADHVLQERYDVPFILLSEADGRKHLLRRMQKQVEEVSVLGFV
jgi:hypothetical protein